MYEPHMCVFIVLTNLHFRFQSYGSCCILLYDAIQKLLCGLPQSDWSKNLGAVDTCIRVLAFGGTFDPVSRKFHKALVLYSGMLHAARQDENETTPAIPRSAELATSVYSARSSEHLLVLRDGEFLFHLAARHLLTLVCKPYASHESMAILELPMGVI